MPGKMMVLEKSDFEYESGVEKFTDIINSNGFTHNEEDILIDIVCEINNQYSYADYHLIFPTSEDDTREYGSTLFTFISIMAIRSNLGYIRLFFDENGVYNAIPIYQRIMRKKQTGNDTTAGNGTVSLKNSNSPINANPEVINPTSKSHSTSDSKSTITYNNTTDYDNINETEMRNYYLRLETLITWIRKNWFDYLIYEFQVNNA